MPTRTRQEVSSPSRRNLPSPFLVFLPCRLCFCNQLIAHPGHDVIRVNGNPSSHFRSSHPTSTVFSKTGDRPILTPRRSQQRISPGGPSMEQHTHLSRPIRRELPGKACPFCGGKTYQLVLRAAGTTDESTLLVRCRQCGHPRSLDSDIKSILWI